MLILSQTASHFAHNFSCYFKGQKLSRCWNRYEWDIEADNLCSIAHVPPAFLLVMHVLVIGWQQQFRTAKRVKVGGDLLHAQYLASKEANIITPSVESIVGQAMCKILSFCSENSGCFPIMSCSCEKRYRLSLCVHVPNRKRGAWE